MNFGAKIPIPLASLRAARGQIGPMGTLSRAGSADCDHHARGSALEITSADQMVIPEVPIVRRFGGYACACRLGRRWVGRLSLYVRAVLMHFRHCLAIWDEVASENNNLPIFKSVQISKNSADKAQISADVRFDGFHLCNGGCCRRGS